MAIIGNQNDPLIYVDKAGNFYHGAPPGIPFWDPRHAAAVPIRNQALEAAKRDGAATYSPGTTGFWGNNTPASWGLPEDKSKWGGYTQYLQATKLYPNAPAPKTFGDTNKTLIYADSEGNKYYTGSEKQAEEIALKEGAATRSEVKPGFWGEGPSGGEIKIKPQSEWGGLGYESEIIKRGLGYKAANTPDNWIKNDAIIKLGGSEGLTWDKAYWESKLQNGKFIDPQAAEAFSKNAVNAYNPQKQAGYGDYKAIAQQYFPELHTQTSDYWNQVVAEHSKSGGFLNLAKTALTSPATAMLLAPFGGAIANSLTPAGQAAIAGTAAPTVAATTAPVATTTAATTAATTPLSNVPGTAEWLAANASGPVTQTIPAGLTSTGEFSGIFGSTPGIAAAPGTIGATMAKTGLPATVQNANPFAGPVGDVSVGGTPVDSSGAPINSGGGEPPSGGGTGNGGNAPPTGAGMSGLTDWLRENASWLLPGLGAVAGAVGSNDIPANITTDRAPWPGVQPTIMAGQDLALNDTTDFGPYQGQRVAGFSPEQEQALGLLAQRSGGIPLENAAQQMATRTLQGDYLNPATNQPLQNMLDYTTRNVVKNYGGLLGRNFGNAGVLQNMAEDIGRGTAGVYQTERAIQPQMAAMAPQLSGMDYTNIGNLMDAGNMRQNLAQQQLQTPWSQHLEQQQAPYNQLQLLQNAASMGTGFGSQTSPNPNQMSPWAGALSGALGVGGIMAQMGK